VMSVTYIQSHSCCSQNLFSECQIFVKSVKHFEEKIIDLKFLFLVPLTKLALGRLACLMSSFQQQNHYSTSDEFFFPYCFSFFQCGCSCVTNRVVVLLEYLQVLRTCMTYIYIYNIKTNLFSVLHAAR